MNLHSCIAYPCEEEREDGAFCTAHLAEFNKSRASGKVKQLLIDMANYAKTVRK
jgi:hypothetical protein